MGKAALSTACPHEPVLRQLHYPGSFITPAAQSPVQVWPHSWSAGSQVGCGAGQPMKPGIKILAGEWVQWNNQVKEGFTKKIGKEEEGRIGHRQWIDLASTKCPSLTTCSP